MSRCDREVPRILLALFTVFSFAGAASASAQEVQFKRGRAGSPHAEQVLQEVLARGRYLVIVADTILAADQTISTDVIVLRATLRVEGRVRGDLIAVQSDVFVRPGARFDGSVAVLAGGFYGSSLARLRRPVVDASSYEYGVDEQESGYTIIGPGGRTGLRLPGLYGLLMPRYERVSALILTWGIELKSAGSNLTPEVEGRVRYRTAPEELEGDLELHWPFGRHDFYLRGGRAVRTNDDWRAGDLANSLYSLIAAQDTRNYYRADFAEVGARLAHGTRVFWLHEIAVSWERADSLVNRDPFSIFSTRGGFQPNLSVPEDELLSLRLSSLIQPWSQAGVSLEVLLDFEYADRELAGDVSFGLLGAEVRAQLATFAGQQLLLAGRGQFPTTREAPPQRWLALGGWGTIPTLVAVEREGDRFWWAEATYRIPLTRDAALGQPLVPWIRYAVGNAWTRGVERPSAVHNIAVGVSLGPLGAAAYSDPEADFRTVLTFEIRAYR